MQRDDAVRQSQEKDPGHPVGRFVQITSEDKRLGTGFLSSEHNGATFWMRGS